MTEVVFPPQTVAGETSIAFDLPALSDPHPSRFNDEAEKKQAAQEWLHKGGGSHGASCLGGGRKEREFMAALLNGNDFAARSNATHDEGLYDGAAFQVSPETK